MLKLKNKKGQSTLEYTILATAVIVGIIAFAAGNESPFRTALDTTLTESTESMTTMGVRLGASQPAEPANEPEPPPPEDGEGTEATDG